MQKATAILVFVALLVMLSGCKGGASSTEPAELTAKGAAKIARAHLKSGGSQQTLDTITNFNSPSVARMDGYGPQKQGVWKVTFTTTQDPLLGSITLYLDRHTGDVLGGDPRD